GRSRRSARLAPRAVSCRGRGKEGPRSAPWSEHSPSIGRSGRENGGVRKVKLVAHLLRLGDHLVLRDLGEAIQGRAPGALSHTDEPEISQLRDNRGRQWR